MPRGQRTYHFVVIADVDKQRTTRVFPDLLNAQQFAQTTYGANKGASIRVYKSSLVQHLTSVNMFDS